jgi:hypothetical protein
MKKDEKNIEIELKSINLKALLKEEDNQQGYTHF